MVEVVASKITKTQIFYECPFCFTNKGRTQHYPSPYLKNGKLATNRIPTVHRHGNERQSTDDMVWTTHRSSHCMFNQEPVEIHITNETKRL